MNDARQAFGLTLRTHRERQGIPLTTIAESTKISIGLLTALEHSDLSRWPKGIFRRAFFREYVTAIGLSPERYLVEFAQLFPDNESFRQPESSAELRLTLVDTNNRFGRTWRRAAFALCEVGGILTVGAIAAGLAGVDLWRGSGLIALVYYPLSNLCLDRTLLRRKAHVPTSNFTENWATPDFRLSTNDQPVEA